MKKILVPALLLSLFLTSCGTEPIADKKEDKLPFAIETKKASDFSRSYSTEKTGRLVGSSTITLASQGMGRIESITVKEGASVKKGQVLARLSDTTANYLLKLEQSKNSLRNADVNIESTKLQLDKAVDDARLALEKAKLAYETTKADGEKRIEKAKRDAEKSNVSSSQSDASVTLEQLKASLEKAELDYQNLQSSNRETINNLDPSYQLHVNDLKKHLSKILYESDKLFGFTDKFKNENIDMRRYFGARDPSTRTALDNAYRDLINSSNTFDAEVSAHVDENNVLSSLSALSSRYLASRNFLDAAQKYIENSIPASALPQSAIDAYVAAFTGYKAELSGLEAAQVAFRNSTNSFLKTYKNNEASAAAALDVQRKQIATQENALENGQFDTRLSLERAQISITNEIEQSRIAYENADSSYKNAVSNRDVSLRKLQVGRTDASLGVEQSEKEASKLTITAPIDGTVTRVIASVGQEITTGNPVIEVASRNPEVVFTLDSDSVSLLQIGSNEEVEYEGKTYTGTVVGLSQVATDALLHTARIVLSESPKYLGGVATIHLELKSEYPLIPASMVKIVSEQEGELSTLSGETIAVKSVKLGKVNGSLVEIITPLDANTELITSDVANFDPKKFYPQKKNV